MPTLPNILLEQFRNYLASKEVSKVTVKNYLSDLRKFLHWFEQSFGKEFEPQDLTADVVELYEKTKAGKIESTGYGLQTTDIKEVSVRSFERYLSMLRKFAHFLKEEKLIEQNPFDQIINNQQSIINKSDLWHLKAFRDYLYVYGASNLTIKNYIVDINAFTRWIEQTLSLASQGETLRGQNMSLINQALIEEYKQRLISVLELSPKSVNRKLSSIRKYIQFAVDQNLIKNALGDSHFAIRNLENNERQATSNRLSLDDLKETENNQQSIINNQYSKLPPVRLFQKLFAPYAILEDQVASRIARFIKTRYLEIKTGGFSQIYQRKSFTNVPKEMYAPHEISLKGKPFVYKAFHHARFTRPNWYKRYHNYAFVHYFHFAILVIYASSVGFLIYTALFKEPQTSSKALAVATAPPRILSFQGRLTDQNDNPITSATDLRFQVYDDSAATGAGNLLWQEVIEVSPDQDGIFSELLGNGSTCTGQPLTVQQTRCAIPATVFTDNATLYLGIAVESTAELTPRQRLAAVAYAANSESLQGMLPITDVAAGQTNVVLALDSSGNLSIGGSAAPTFEATGGQFKLSGQPLLLTTNTGTDSNVIIDPDGLGGVDVRKPLVNTTATGNISPGGVEVNDKFGVLATESAVAAFVVNNNTTGGDIIAASSSGTTRFVVQNNGDVSFMAGAALDTISTGTLSIGGATATTISIGRSTQGITLPGFTAQNGVLYGTNGTGVLGQVTTASSNLCLVSGADNPSWATCPGGTGGVFQELSGAIVPNNSTLDFLIGAQATTSAKFSVLNMTGSLTPVASVSSGLSGTSMYMTADGTLATQNRMSLTIGNSSTYDTTGNVLINPNGTGNVGIGTTAPGSTLEVASSKTINFNSSPVSNLTLGTAIDINSQSINNAAYIYGATGDGLYIKSKYQGVSSGALNFSTAGAAAGYADTIRLAFGSGAAQGSAGITSYEPLYVTATANSYFTGNVGVGTTDPDQKLDILAAGGDTQLRLTSTDGIVYTDFATNQVGMLNISPSGGSATVSGILKVSGGTTGGLSALIVDQLGAATNDIFTASAGGAPKFTIQNDGTIVSAKYTSQNGVLYGTQTTGVLAQATTGSSNQCLLSGASNPTWGSCSAGVTNDPFWQQTSGALLPNNATVDLLIGGTSTASAKFGFINVNSGTPTATIAGNLTFDAAGVIATTKNQALTIGNSTTGDISVEGRDVGNAQVAGSLALTGGDVTPTGGGSGTSGSVTIRAGNIALVDNTNISAAGVTITGGRGLSNGSGGTVTVQGGPHEVASGILGGGGSLTLAGGDSTKTIGSAGGTEGDGGNVTLRGGIGYGTGPGGTVSITGGTPGATGTGGAITLTTGAGGSGSGNSGALTLGTGAVTSGSFGTISIKQGSNTRIFVDTGGNVGVGGQTTPLTALDVTGSASLSANLSLRGAETAHTFNILDNGTLNIQRSPGGDAGLTTALFIQNNGNVGIGTTAPVGALEVNKEQVGKALAIFDQDGTDNIIAASASGTTKFTLSNAGVASFVGGQTADITSLGNANLTLSAGGTGDLRLLSDADTDIILPNFNANNNILYATVTSGVLAGASTDTQNFCLVSGASAPSWSSCSAAASNWWNQSSGALYPLNSTVDLLVGAQATTSAKFSVLNMTGTGTPVASVSSGLSGTSMYMTADGTLATQKRMSLTIGNSSTYDTTGNILINPNGTGLVGVRTIDPVGAVNIIPIGNINNGGALDNTQAGLLIGTTTSGISFDANQIESSGSNLYLNFSSNQHLSLASGGGNVGIGTGTTSPAQKLEVFAGAGSTQLRLSSTLGSVYTDFKTDQIGDLTITPTGADATISGRLKVSGGNTGGIAALIVDQTGASTNPIFTASASGNTRFTIANDGDLTITNGDTITASSLASFTTAATLSFSGDITITGNDITNTTLNLGNGSAATIGTVSDDNLSLSPHGTGDIRLVNDGDTDIIMPGFTGNNSILYTAVSTGVLTAAVTSTSDQCLLSGAGAGYAPSWQTCPGGVDTTDVWWNQSAGALYPNNSTVDLLVGGQATTSAKFAVLNMNTGIPIATVSGNMIVMPNDGNGGFVGIGTTTPTVPLAVKYHVANSTTGNPVLSLDNPSGGTQTVLSFKINGTDVARIRADSSSNLILGDGVPGSVQISSTLNMNGYEVHRVASLFGPDNADLVISPNTNTADSTEGDLLLKTLDSGPNSRVTALQIDANGANPSMYLLGTGTGSVGIGNTSPLTKLDITGSASLSANLSLRGAATAHTFNILDNGTLNIQRSPGGDGGLATALFIQNNGNVGIGTTGPDRKLDILDASNPQMRLSQADGTVYADFQMDSNGDLLMNVDGVSNQLVLDNGGNVGVGTATPASPLEVDGSSGTPSLSAENGIAMFGLAANVFLEVGMDSSSPWGMWLQAKKPADDSSFALNLNPLGGNVGIGTRNPQDILHVSSAAVTNAHYNTGDTNVIFEGGDTNLQIISDDGGNWASNLFLTSAPSTGDNKHWALSHRSSSQSDRFDLSYITTASGGDITGGTVTNVLSALTGGNVGIGTTDPLSTLHVSGGNTGGRAALIVDQIGASTNDIMAASASGGITKFRLTNGGAIYAASFYDLDNTSYFLDPAATDTSLVTVGKVGIGASSASVALDVNGLSGTTAVTKITGTTSFAALNIKQSGVGDLIAASGSSTTNFLVKNNGDVVVGNGGGGKITVTTIDPLYSIDGGKYSTYAPSMIGVKEEITGKASVAYDQTQDAYAYTLDFNSFEQSSDLWVFSRVIDPDIENVSVLLTPNSQARTWYRKDPVRRLLTFYSDRPTEISYRLTAPRFDYERWGTISNDTETGLAAPPAPPPVGNGTPDGDDDFFANLNIAFHNGTYELIDVFGNAVHRVEAFSNLMAANIEAGLINAKAISTNSLAVATDSITIGGQTIQDYIASTVSNILDTQYSILNTGEAIVSPLASIDEVRTNIISPLADSQIAVKGDLAVKDENNQTVAKIDTKGDLTAQNASIAGELSANQVYTEELSSERASISGNLTAGSASISGTLYADRIQANSIEGLEARIASVAAQSVLSSKYNVSSISGEFDIASILNTKYLIPNTGFLDIENLSADFATFRDGLISLGPVTFNQASVLESFSIGNSFIFGPNSINTLSLDLEIQPLKQGAISLMAGAVKINTDGTLVVNENATFAKDVSVRGKLSANIISPLPDQNLSLKLDESDLSILNSSNSATLSINSSGDLTSSGSGTFAKLNLFAKPVEAISDTEVVATSSAGTAAIKAFRTEVTINNPNVTESSLIYITPVGNTNPIYLLRQNPEDPTLSGVEGSFTVGTSKPSYYDIQFNFLIVN